MNSHLVCQDLVSLFNVLSNSVGNLMPNLSFIEEEQRYYLAHILAEPGIHVFCQVINSKDNVVAAMEFERTEYDVNVQDISHYTINVRFKNYQEK